MTREIVDRCPINETYQTVVGETAAGFLRAALMNLDWVRVQVQDNALLDREKRFFRRELDRAQSVDGVAGSLHYLLAGNGISTRAALEEARVMHAETSYTRPEVLAGLMDASPSDVSVILDAEHVLSSFFDRMLAPAEL